MKSKLTVICLYVLVSTDISLCQEQGFLYFGATKQEIISYLGIPTEISSEKESVLLTYIYSYSSILEETNMFTYKLKNDKCYSIINAYTYSDTLFALIKFNAIVKASRLDNEVLQDDTYKKRFLYKTYIVTISFTKFDSYIVVWSITNLQQ